MTLAYAENKNSLLKNIQSTTLKCFAFIALTELGIILTDPNGVKPSENLINLKETVLSAKESITRNFSSQKADSLDTADGLKNPLKQNP